MGLEKDPDGTLLSEEEKEGLLLPGILTRKQLDEHEQKNIEDALVWLISRPPDPAKILTEPFIKLLHKHMYGKTWKWSGNFRKSDKNIGIKWSTISLELRKLLDDTLYWIENKVYPPEEIAIRFKHRLVSIHCFPNGNGRHSRLMADIMMERIFKLPRFEWSGNDLQDTSQLRKDYITALRKADEGDMDELISFAKT